MYSVESGLSKLYILPCLLITAYSAYNVVIVFSALCEL